MMISSSRNRHDDDDKTKDSPPSIMMIQKVKIPLYIIQDINNHKEKKMMRAAVGLILPYHPKEG